MSETSAGPAARSYAFGPFRLFPARQLLLRDDVPVRIGGRALDILAALVDRPGEVVGKRELIARVWPDTFVDEGNLKVNMNALRRALGEEHGTPRYVATVVGRGYRFVAPVLPFVPDEAVPEAVPARDNNLPTATTRIVGRQDAIAGILRDFSDARLVSVVGPGGVGKTTVAIAAAEQMVGRMRDGVWLVDLSPLKDPELVPNAVATALGLAAHSANMLAALGEFLRDREALLVLDSCEHLVDAVAACVDRLLAGAPDLYLLATSREPLRVKGERVRRLPALGVPASTAGLGAEAALVYPAVQLFVDRATDRVEAFTLSDQEAPLAAEICRRLDGLALAIELAATRVDAFGVRGLLGQIDDRFGLLQGRRGGVERHRTLTATIDWSYDLLSDSERTTMRCLSTFAATFSLDAAVALAGDGGTPRGTVIEDIASLVAKSLLTAEVRDSEVEYRLLDTTRAYALGKLDELGESGAARRRHAEHVLAATAAGSGERRSADAGAGSARIDDMRDALRWAFGDAGDAGLGLRLTVAVLPTWKHLSLFEECRAAVERALEPRYAAVRSVRDDLILNLTLGATLLHTRGPLAEVKASLSRALGIAEALADTELQLECLAGLSEYELWTGDSHAAIAVADRIRALSKQGEAGAAGDADAQAGSALSWLGALAAAQRRLEGIVRRPVGPNLRPDAARFEFDQRLTARGALATVLWLQGFPDQALATARQQLAEAEASNYAVSLCCALLHGSLIIAMYVRDYDAALRHIARGSEHAEKHGLAIWRDMAACTQGRLNLYLGRPTDLAAYREVLARVREGGFRMRYPNYLTNYGEAVARQGDVPGGLAAIDEAMALSRANGQVVGIPEILRIKGNIIRFADPAASERAADCYRESIELAQRDGSLSWELRSATSLVKLVRARGGDPAAEAALSSAYGRFREGFSTGDLMRARALLDDLGRV